MKTSFSFISLVFIFYLIGCTPVEHDLSILEKLEINKEISKALKNNLPALVYKVTSGNLDSQQLEEGKSRLVLGFPYMVSEMKLIKPREVDCQSEIESYLNVNPEYSIPVFTNKQLVCKLHFSCFMQVGNGEYEYELDLEKSIRADKLTKNKNRIAEHAFRVKKERPVFVEYCPDSFLFDPIRFYFFQSEGMKTAQFVSEYDLNNLTGSSCIVIDSLNNAMEEYSTYFSGWIECNGRCKATRITGDEDSTVRALFNQYHLHPIAGEPVERYRYLEHEGSFYNLCAISHRIGLCPEHAWGKTVKQLTYELKEKAWSQKSSYGVAYIYDSSIIGATLSFSGYGGGPSDLTQRSCLRPDRYSFPCCIADDIDSIWVAGPWDKSEKRRCWIHKLCIRGHKHVLDFTKLLSQSEEASGEVKYKINDPVDKYLIMIIYKNGASSNHNLIVKNEQLLICCNGKHYIASEKMKKFITKIAPRIE